jgi:tRNA dimethylallyltransferase
MALELAAHLVVPPSPLSVNEPFPQNAWIRPPILDAWYLTGPTASGKSQIAIELAQRLGAEIVSVDSMAVYRGMDIGTAKPTPVDRQRVPHHLIDILEPTQDYSVSQFVMDAHRIAVQIREAGKRILFAGGTPLYLKSLLRGLFLGPEADWDFRRNVHADVEKFGIDALRQRLMDVDPLSAHKILPGDVRRMTRALEVAKVTGRPLSHWQSQFERVSPIESGRAWCLGWERSVLHERVNQRVDRMLDVGLVEEVRSLLEAHGCLGRTAAQAVGYKETLQFLAGGLDPTALSELIKSHTRQFVRRQEIWFRSMPELPRLAMQDNRAVGEVVAAWKCG